MRTKGAELAGSDKWERDGGSLGATLAKNSKPRLPFDTTAYVLISAKDRPRRDT